MKVNWLTKLMLKFWPSLVMKRFAKKLGIKDPVFDRIHQSFSKVNRVDLIPFEPGQRGFMIILDQKTALYFYQDGDHFVYDGFEMGEYEKGDVTIFDNLKR